jgi:hypothetical protein
MRMARTATTVMAGSRRQWRRAPERGGAVAQEGPPARSGTGQPVTEGYPYELRLPEAPYRFEWQGEAAVDARKRATDHYAEERYTHADGTLTVIREYRADGTFHIMSDRGEIELIDNARSPLSPDPVSVVRLP